MTRKRSRKLRARFGGRDCTGGSQVEEACNLRPCPIDCEWGEWNLWSSCSVTCGGGQIMRFRNVTKKAMHGGRCCIGPANETRECMSGLCPVACRWGPWGRWGECSKTCGFGNATRTRRIKSEAVGGGKACAGPLNETIECNTDSCPIDCKWEEWKSWGACSAACGNGTHARRRGKALEAKYGGKDCEGIGVEQGPCIQQECVVDCQWGEWTAWPACSVTCGGGITERNRTVSVQPSSGGKQCQGSPKESVSCGVQGCPVNCEWTEWGNWSDCSRTCGGGKIVRTRQKALEAANGGSECSGGSNETKECNLDGCPVDCEWGEWSPWSNCSKTCGGGTIVHRRNITTQATNDGRECQGKYEVVLPCNEDGCPVDCKWSDWERWTSCTRTCGNGTSMRDRKMKVEPKNGGTPCDGGAHETQPCNTDPCPVNCHWDEWGNWTECSQTCGSGIRSRTRKPLDNPKNGGTDCPGHSTQQEDCNTQVCPTDCGWEPWSEWGPCPVTCGGATLTRVRAKQHEDNGGQPCLGAGNQTKICGKGPCTPPLPTSAPVPNTTTTAEVAQEADLVPVPDAEETPATLPAANSTAGFPRHITGDVVIDLIRAQGFASNEQDRNALAAALAMATGVSNVSVIVTSLEMVGGDSFLLALNSRSRLGVGIVDGRFEIETDSILGPVIYNRLLQLNVSYVTFLLADQLVRSNLEYIPEVVSISVDMVEGPGNGAATAPASASAAAASANASASASAGNSSAATSSSESNSSASDSDASSTSTVSNASTINVTRSGELGSVASSVSPVKYNTPLSPAPVASAPPPATAPKPAATQASSPEAGSHSAAIRLGVGSLTVMMSLLLGLTEDLAAAADRAV